MGSDQERFRSPGDLRLLGPRGISGGPSVLGQNGIGLSDHPGGGRTLAFARGAIEETIPFVAHPGKAGR